MEEKNKVIVFTLIIIALILIFGLVYVLVNDTKPDQFIVLQKYKNGLKLVYDKDTKIMYYNINNEGLSPYYTIIDGQPQIGVYTNEREID